MKILIVGSGGREHAIAWRLSKRPGNELFAMPGNPGIARLAACVPAVTLSPKSILSAAHALGVDLTIIGPEAPLVAGVVDLFRAADLPIVGPTAAAARLEGSKIYAKRFFAEHRIPTANFEAVTTQAESQTALEHFSFPVVIKADGLAAGKGVVIAQTKAEAQQAIVQLGLPLIIEEFLTGPEVSFIALSDGRTAVPLLPSRDHKRALDGDLGPNTGGMGAFCDASLLTQLQETQILEQMIWPTIEATGFTGFLYAGVMLTPSGPRLLEYNVRLGDPETQALMHHFDDDLASLLLSAAQGHLGSPQLQWKPGTSHSVVLAAHGYPGTYRSGDAITGLTEAENKGAVIFHSGTRVGWSGYVTAGGRVITVTSSGANIAEAASNTYAHIAPIHFEGMHYRSDIGRTVVNTPSEPDIIVSEWARSSAG
jgi:phosphoribosylamine--glycine ligase